MEKRLKQIADGLFEQYFRNDEYIEIIFSPKGDILYINKVLPIYYIETVIGSNIFDFVSSNSIFITKESIDKALHSESRVIYETIYPLDQQHSIYFLNRLKKEIIDEHTTVLHLFSIDITTIKCIYDELISKNEECILQNITSLDKNIFFRKLSGDLSIIYANHAYSQLRGFASKIDLAEIYSENTRKKYKKHIEDVLLQPLAKMIETEESCSNGILFKCKWLDRRVWKESGNYEIHSYGTISTFVTNCDKSLQFSSLQKIIGNPSAAFWEEDASELKKYVDSQKIEVEDIESYINSNIKFVLKCASLIKITNINCKILFLFGIKNLDEFNRKGILSFFNTETLEIFKKRLIAFAKGHTFFESPCTSMDTNGNLLDYIVKIMIHDTCKDTHSKVFVFIELDAEKNRLKREIEKQYNQLVKVDRMKNMEIVANGIAHEINNPNHIIMLNTSLIRQAHFEIVGILDNYAHDNFQIMRMGYSQFKNMMPELITGIEKSSEKIKYVVTELRDYTTQNSEKEIHDINKLVKRAITFTKNQINKFTDHFEVEYFKTPIYIFADKVRIEQLIINIIENACQSLTNKSENIKITITQPNKKKAIVEIVDNGVGISEDNLEFVFNPFFTTKRDSGGIGLGLFVSYTILKEHNGSIEIFPNINKGTLVRITIPCTQKSL